MVVDPWANEEDAKKEYGVNLTAFADVKDADCIIVAVAHNEFKELSLGDIKKLYRSDISDEEKVLVDVKGLYSVPELNKSGLSWWRL